MSVSHARYTHGHDATVLKSHTSRTVRNSARYLEPYLRPATAGVDVEFWRADIYDAAEAVRFAA